jgi:hypothetical protein
MKKKTILFFLIIIFLGFSPFAFSSIASAQTGGDPIVIEPPLDALTLEEAIEGVIKFIFQLAIVIAPLTIIWSGFLFATAAGNYEQINRARNVLLWTAIGFGIVLFARIIFEAIKALLSFGG